MPLDSFMTEMEQVLAEKMPSGNVAARMSEPAVSSTSSCEMQLWLGIIDVLQIPEIISDRCQNLSRQLLKALRKICVIEHLVLKFNNKNRQNNYRSSSFYFNCPKVSPLEGNWKIPANHNPTKHFTPPSSVTTTTINRPT